MLNLCSAIISSSISLLYCSATISSSLHLSTPPLISLSCLKNGFLQLWSLTRLILRIVFAKSQFFLCTHHRCCYIWANWAVIFPRFSSVICNTILKASLNTSTLLSRIPGFLTFAFAMHRRCNNYTFLSWNIAETDLFSKRQVRYSKINIVRQWHELWCNINTIFSLNSMGISYNTNITKNLLILILV